MPGFKRCRGQKGLDGARSGLFMEAVRIVREMRKRQMENIQSTLYGKMWPGLFQAIKAKISAGSWKKSQKATFQCLKVENGQMPEWLELREQGAVQCTAWRMLDAQFWECPNVENVSTLSAILEADVPDKYFLSAKACWGIIRRAQEKQRKSQPY